MNDYNYMYAILVAFHKVNDEGKVLTNQKFQMVLAIILCMMAVLFILRMKKERN